MPKFPHCIVDLSCAGLKYKKKNSLSSKCYPMNRFLMYAALDKTCYIYLHMAETKSAALTQMAFCK